MKLETCDLWMESHVLQTIQLDDFAVAGTVFLFPLVFAAAAAAAV